ncbi:MAG: ABC transporter permease [Ferruginibacter sp.]
MLKNYLKVLFRNIFKSKVFSLINLTGLSIGMGAAILIFLWIGNELSMDRFYSKIDRIYVMYNRDKDPSGQAWAWNNTPKILAPTLKKDYPEVEDVTRFNNITFLLVNGEKKLNKRGAFADSGFLKILDFPLKAGNAATALATPNSIVLTESAAKAVFGNEDPMGKTVRVDSVHNCTVTAVLKDLPANTQFRFEYLLPWSYMQKLNWDDDNWQNNSVRTFVLLKEGASQASFDSKIKNITIDHTKEGGNPATTEVFTQPMKRFYLYGKSENAKLVGGQIEIVRLFGIIAAFILLIACINFMNLSTARSEKRAKEVGIRKVAGAGKTMLVIQFLCESILLSLMAFIIAIFLVQISLKSFNTLVGKELFIDYKNIMFWSACAGFVLLTGIIAGSYPAFYLSSFTPVKVLKGTFKKVNALVAPRKVLVILQFSFAIILIIATSIIVRQIQYGLKREIGYEKNNLIYAFTQGNIDKHYQAIKSELINSGAVTSITQSANPITQRWSDSWGFKWPGSTKGDEKIDFLRLGSDADFAKTIGVKIIQGRDIDVYKYPTDSNSVLLNEAAVKAMRLKDPIGTVIGSVGDTSNSGSTVVGVIKDFVIESPFQHDISPLMVFGPGRDFAQVLHMKLNTAIDPKTNIATIEKIIKKFNPDYPFEYVFADESYANKFKDTQRTGTLASLFAGLTIFISCLGLFGLAAYMAESRIKEIGVRKVLGASVMGITTLISKDFLKLVLIAFIIAVPVAWYFMSKWLDDFSYKIGIEWWVFALAGLASLLIALLTVGYQAVSAARANPVKSLRTE